MTNVSQQSLGTILLVEDNDADIELARIMLVEEAQLQCNFIIARDGREALERLHEAGQPIDLLLLDINMPGMDGFELLKRMRNEDGLKLLPVVMCTTSTYDKDMDRAKGLGVAGYMTKPAGLNKLKLIIDNINGVSLSPLDNGFALLRTEKSAAH